MKKWSNDIKIKANQLRLSGLSYGQLTKELKVPKSTLHQWIRGIRRPVKFTKLDRVNWIKDIQPLGAQANRRKREERIKYIIHKEKKEIAAMPINNDMGKAILSTIYLAEGSKVRGILQFANTDPRLILLFITLLRRCYQLDESKFRIRLHLHYYHKVREVRIYWSNLLGIPTKQFGKIYRKSRSKEKTFRRNFGGICFVRYNSVDLKEQIVQYGYALAEKITGVINAPVA